MSASSINLGLHHHVNKLVYLHDLACIVMYCHVWLFWTLHICLWSKYCHHSLFGATGVPPVANHSTNRASHLVQSGHTAALVKKTSKHHQQTTQNSIVSRFSRSKSLKCGNFGSGWGHHRIWQSHQPELKRRTRCHKWIPESTFENIKSQWVGISLRMWNQYIW